MNNHTEAIDRFRCLLKQQGRAFRERVRERSKHLEDCIDVDGECTASFNKVLRGTSFALKLVRGRLPRLTTSPARAEEAAAILCQVSLQGGLVKVEEDKGVQYLGWSNLNLDAKGWCKNLLLAPAPRKTTLDEFRDLIVAKLFAAILIDHLLPPTFRAFAKVDRVVILDVNSVEE